MGLTWFFFFLVFPAIFSDIFSHFRPILTTLNSLGHQVRHYLNRQKASVTPLKIFAPEWVLSKEFGWHMYLGKQMQLLLKKMFIEMNVSQLPIKRKLQEDFFLLFCEKNKTNKFINHFVLKISSVIVLQQVAIKKRILFLYRNCIVQYLFTDIRYRDI